ncbi:hypothetical protein SprV_0200910800 [Sparganum proliferum]
MDTARAYVATAESIGKGGVIAGLPKAKKLKCLYSNAQSLLSKSDELKIYVNQTLPDVISITETWLSASVDDREVASSGYHLFRKDRSGRQGGGVLTYVKYGLFASEKEGQLARTTETLWLTIKTPGSQPLEILTVYRPPRNDPQSDSSLLEELETISIRPNVMIMGDFYAPNIDWNLTSAPGSEFNFDRRLLKSVQRSHLTQHVSSPTRLREGQLANCLDLVLTKAPESVDVVNCLPPLGKSDHVVLQWEYSLFSVPDQSMVIGRNIWRGDFGQMRLDMRRRDWKPALTGCVLKDWLELKAVLNELITRYCPMSKKKITSRPRWLKCSLKVEVNRKQRLWKAYLRDKTNDSMNRYKAQRNRVKCLVYKARQDFEGNLLNYAGENTKLFFNCIRQSTRNRDPIPMIKRDDGVELYKDDEKAKHLSRFFQSVFTRDVAVPADHYNVDDVQTIDSVVLTKAIVQQELLKLKEAKSPGPDEIPAKLLKELATELAEPLCLLFQASLDEGRLPPEWKTAWISPIHKSGSRASANNYRPVSLTSICCKVMERIIKRELMRFLEQHHLLSNAQHGFRRGRSCLTNLLYCLEQWTRATDEGNVVHVADIDFKKAFDSAPHQLLLYKLSRIRVRGKLLKWIKNFLIGRSQTVRLGGQQSAEVTVASGVPQGSVLGPILFLIYIDDCIHVLDCDIAMFADDIKLWTVIRNEDDEAKLQANLDRLEQWSGYWLLSFNVSKCNILRIGRTSTAHRQTYYLNHTPLPVVEVQKDLGVWITSSLKPSFHCLKSAKSAMSSLYLIKRAFAKFDEECFSKVFGMFVRPQLECAIQAWRPWSVKDRTTLEKVQRRATKLVRGYKNLPYETRLSNLNLFPLDYRQLRGDLIQTFRMLRGQDCCLASGDFFQLATTTSLRGHPLKLRVTGARLDARRSFFSHRVVNAWNALPVDVVMSSSVNSFKRKLDQRRDMYLHGIRNQQIFPLPPAP